MNRTEKEALVTDLGRALGDATLLVITRQSGLTVAEVSSLRSQMRAVGANYKVAKNRLTKRALEGTKFQALQPLFTGPTAIAYSADPVAAAKVCVEFAKKNDKLTVVGGALDAEELDAGQIQALAQLPSLYELRGTLIGLLQAPVTKLAGVTQAPAAQLARVFGAYAARENAA